MNNVRRNYRDVRETMQPGDVIAFGGKGRFSEIIKWSTRSIVSHVGVVLKSKLLLDDTPQQGFFNQLIESTTLDGFAGVSIRRISDRISTYGGEIWWLPLRDEARQAADFNVFYDFLLHQEHKPYDMPQAVKSALDALDNIPIAGAATRNLEDFSKFFCSELVAAGLEAAGVISNVNASEVTPIDLCRFNIFKNEYHQLKGTTKSINGFNTLHPTGWGM